MSDDAGRSTVSVTTDNYHRLMRLMFEFEYAYASGITVDDLHEMGCYAVPCNCGEANCPGWQMRYLRNLLTPRFDAAVEHIPENWDAQELLDALVADGQTDLVQMLYAVIET